VCRGDIKAGDCLGEEDHKATEKRDIENGEKCEQSTNIYTYIYTYTYIYIYIHIHACMYENVIMKTLTLNANKNINPSF
jgi:ATP-dependent protease ClpP protease subunit